MSKNNNTKVKLYKKSTSPFGHGDPSIPELVGTMTYGEANTIKTHNRHSDEYEYIIEFIEGEIEPKKSKINNQKFDALVFIGRFQPFHNGHKAVIDAALKQAKEIVIVIGSSFQARNIRNPFTFEERKAMIKAVYPQDNVNVVPVSDYPYDDNKWMNSIRIAVKNTVPEAENIGLIGHSKDSTSYYLEIFPDWKGHVEVDNVDGINATDIRVALLGDNEENISVMHLMPLSALKTVSKIIGAGPDGYSESWLTLRAEYKMVKKYKEAWKSAPFPPTFMTVDAVVVQSGHILLVKRGDMPGKGLWALPGGFLNQDETMLDGAIRELKEETKIKVPVPVLKGSIKSSKTFDAPNRSARGRTITQAFFIDLGVGELPKVKGSDDAEKASWVPFNKVDQNKMFEDHWHIIDNFLNIG